MARKIRTRTPNTTYLILVEGKTEEIYFKKLKGHCEKHGFNIKVRQASHGNPEPLVHEALREQDEGIYNFIWCVYDCDVFQHSNTESFETVYKKALKNGIQFAESVPSIEAWFILHYGKLKKFYQGKDAVIKDLQRHIPGYCKEQRWQEKNLYPTLEPRQKEAFSNVKGFELTDHKDQRSATSVHRLVEIFISESGVGALGSG
jgi:hypothetical protein